MPTFNELFQPKLNQQNAMQQPAKPRKKRSLAQSLSREAVKLAILWAVLSPFVAMPLYNWLLFPADRNSYDQTVKAPIAQLAKELNVAKSDEWLTAPDGKRINGWFFQKPGAAKVVLL
ncbi:MAG: hypothetical protein ACRD3W_12275, partial [Terriglobales bacterium]